MGCPRRYVPLGSALIRSDPPITRRSDPPCEVVFHAEDGKSTTCLADPWEPFQVKMEAVCKEFGLDMWETEFYDRDLPIHPTDPFSVTNGAPVRVVTRKGPPPRALLKSDSEGKKVLVNMKPGSKEVPLWAAFEALARAYPFDKYTYYYRCRKTRKRLALKPAFCGMLHSNAITVVPRNGGGPKLSIPIVKCPVNGVKSDEECGAGSGKA